MPRTEQEILNDFEEIGYNITHYPVNKCYNLTGMGFVITINKNEKKYGMKTQFRNHIRIDIQTHKLLHELFEVWQWLI